VSDLPADYRDRLNLREQVARIDEMISRIERQQEETRKFVSEQHKLMAEAKKFGRDPWMLVIGAVIAGLFTRLPEILRALGYQ
jgi:uncharacterized protein (UPF0335 family)